MLITFVLNENQSMIYESLRMRDFDLENNVSTHSCYNLQTKFCQKSRKMRKVVVYKISLNSISKNIIKGDYFKQNHNFQNRIGKEQFDRMLDL